MTDECGWKVAGSGPSQRTASAPWRQPWHGSRQPLHRRRRREPSTMRDRLPIGAGRGRPAAGQGRQRRPTDTPAMTAAAPRTSDADARSSGMKQRHEAAAQVEQVWRIRSAAASFLQFTRGAAAPRGTRGCRPVHLQASGGARAGQKRRASALAAAQPTAAKGCPAGPGFTYIARTMGFLTGFLTSPILCCVRLFMR